LKVRTYRYFSYGLIILPAFIIGMKITLWDYTFKRFLPKTRYEVSYSISAEGFNENVRVSGYIPQSDSRQEIFEETNNSPNTNFRIHQDQSGKKGTWEVPEASGPINLNYSFQFLGTGQEYIIDSSLHIPNDYPPIFEQFLSSTENIQANHPQIKSIYNDVAGDAESVLGILTQIHSYTNSLESRPFKGLTDALTAARLGEASCNGKSRLFVALARSANIPSRLVGGIILNNGTKKTSHQWVEAYISGVWVPFDPLNDHFAYLPHNYLTLYHGDEFLFSHTPNINFDYSFTIKSRLSANPSLLSELESHPFNAYRLWESFDNIGVPIGLLKIILLLPLGAFIVAIFRNVIGLNTFGVFLPALIAVASRETGLLWGIIAFLMVITIVSLVHFPLERWGILYTPKLVIMLVCVVILYQVISYFAIETGIISLAYVTLFPIVVLTISAERFARSVIEDGLREALISTGHTIIVVCFAYIAMGSRSMEAFFLAFPELFMVIIAVNILLGRWTGLRLLEYFRFKPIIQ